MSRKDFESLSSGTRVRRPGAEGVLYVTTILGRVWRHIIWSDGACMVSRRIPNDLVTGESRHVSLDHDGEHIPLGDDWFVDLEIIPSTPTEE